jgi:hypothetical protein
VTGDWQFVIGDWWRMGRKGEKNADGRRKKEEKILILKEVNK